jgi:high-affinity Fe2+/Pb2+ permease
MIHACTAIAVGAAIGAVVALATGYLLLMYGGDSVLGF